MQTLFRRCCNVKVDYAEHTTDGSGWCSVCQQAILPTDGVLYDVSADGTYAEVVAYIGEYSKVKISDTYNNLPVRNIYNGAFKNATITNVFIPDSVTSIGRYSFYNCSGLTSVIFKNPNGWSLSKGNSISEETLSYPSIAAKYLRSTYYKYSWKRV